MRLGPEQKLAKLKSSPAYKTPDENDCLRNVETNGNEFYAFRHPHHKPHLNSFSQIYIYYVISAGIFALDSMDLYVVYIRLCGYIRWHSFR